MTEVEHQTLWTALVEGIAMNGAAQRRRHLYVDVIAVEVHAVVAGMGLLGVVGERRGIVVRVEAAAADGHHGHVQQVPMAFVGVGKAEDGTVLILIAGSRTPHRHGRALHHAVGQGCARIGLAAPGARLAVESVVQVFFLPQCGSAEEGVDIVGQMAGLCMHGNDGSCEDHQAGEDCLLCHYLMVLLLSCLKGTSGEGWRRRSRGCQRVKRWAFFAFFGSMSGAVSETLPLATPRYWFHRWRIFCT